VESSPESKGMLASFRSIQTKLLYSFLLLLILTGCVVVTNIFVYQRIDKLKLVNSRLDNVLVKALQAIKTEKEFFSSGVLDTNFYRVGESEYLTEHARLIAEIRQDLRSVVQSEEEHRFDIEGNLKLLQLELNAYEKSFGNITAHIRIKGFENQGLEGEIHKYSQAIENSSYPFDKIKVLTLLRLEKDYTVRKQRDQAQRFRELYYQIQSELPLEANPHSRRFDSLLTNYHKNFKELVRVEGLIGSNDQGLQSQLRRYTGRIEAQIHSTIDKANQRAQEIRKGFLGVLFTILFFAVILSVIFSYFHSYRISKPVRTLDSQIKKLVSGHIQDDTPKIEPTSNDETNTLTQNFNVMIEEIQFYLNEIKEKNRELETQNLELQAMNEQLAHSEASLRNLNMMKDKFFFIISHDLKGPLNTLLGFLELLNINVDTFSRQEITQVGMSMNTSVRSLLNLLNNLLQWSVAQTGDMKVETVNFPLTHVVNENLELMKETARLKDIQLVADLEKDFLIRSDRNMTDSIVRNLISNAIKFTHAGGVVRVKAREKEALVEIVVEDTGVGISSEDLKQLFRNDVHHSTLGTTQEKGTGFGLLLCKEFVEKNGGQISIQSQLGQGTSISFTLPLVAVMQLEVK
jgi:signal transduction histidine kinase